MQTLLPLARIWGGTRTIRAATAQAGAMSGRRPKPTTPDAALPWSVLIDGKRPGMLWGRFVSSAGAATTARELRGHGFIARVAGPDDKPSLGPVK